MKKALGIVLLVLALSLVSAPAFAQQVELDLRLWYPGVVGADEWVGDYGTYVVEEYPNGLSALQWEPLPHKDENELVLRPGSGLSFILSGDYFITPSISVGGSYWGFSRATEVSVDLKSDLLVPMRIPSDMVRTMNGVPPYWWILMPWMEDEAGINFPQLVIGGEERLSISALDICATKTLSGPGWEVGLSGGVRRAIFNENMSMELEIGYWDLDDDEPWGIKVAASFDSKLNVSAIGPQVGMKGTYALGDKLTLKAGAKAGLLFATAQTDATAEDGVWSIHPGTSEWNLEQPLVVSEHSAKDAVRIITYDLGAFLAYQITDQWSVEAGYYASIWKGVPSALQFSVDESVGSSTAEDDSDNDPILWKQPEARDITVRGLTLGVNFKF